MKSFLFSLVLIFILSSCRGDTTSSLQKIDQVINIYVKDKTGKDLLNPSLAGSFNSEVLYDLNGKFSETRISTAGYGLQINPSSVYYLQYVDGATRVLIDSTSPNLKYYQSNIAVKFGKLVSNQTVITTDTLKVNYKWTPQSFAVSKIYWGKNLVFSKTGSEQNTFTITK